jgi:2-polyprenyl-6-methoxyphenol hydroxylase-like FAD-dependent oxidoreductase
VSEAPEIPVGIVGAGPIGLALALRLATFGVRSVILEADPTLRAQGSKACLIHGDVLDILDKFGCAEQIDAEGVTWTVARTYVRGKEIRRAVYPRPVGFGPFVNISQYRIEQVMLARLEAAPLAEVRWSHRVTGLEQDGDGVTVHTETPDGDRVLRCRYLVGCDGVRSTLRDLLDVRWTGYTHRDRFLITDIRAMLPLEQQRHFHYDPPFNPGRQLVMHPQPDDIWRIDWQLPPDADIEAEQRTGALDRRIRAVIGAVPYEIQWMSTYRFHQRVVEHMRVGRVFLAGDAAHALPPYGSRGMNSGLQDADNLAWKLAFVLDQRAGATLLDTYHVERHAAARENLRVTEATISFMVPPNRLRRWTRAVLLWLAPAVRSLRRHVNSGQMTEPFVYLDSPIVDPAGADPLIGRFAPDGVVTVDDRRTRLRRLLGGGFVGLLYAADAAQAAEFIAAAGAAAGQVPIRLVVVLPPGVPADDLSGPGAADGGTVTVARDADPDLAATYRRQPPCWYLVRPDGHLGAARGLAGPAGIAAALRLCADAPSGRADPLPAATGAHRAGQP